VKRNKKPAGLVIPAGLGGGQVSDLFRSMLAEHFERREIAGTASGRLVFANVLLLKGNHRMKGCIRIQVERLAAARACIRQRADVEGSGGHKNELG
jgi:hypothetical protein